MTQPHHHVFNVLQGEINRCIPIEPILPFLLERGVITSREEPWFRSTKNGMKYLTGYLRSKDYQTFLGFVTCICEAHQSPLGSRKIDYLIVTSIKHIVAEFDARHGTQHVKSIETITDRYYKEVASALTHDLAQMTLEDTADHDKQLEELSTSKVPGFDLPVLSYLEEPQLHKFSQENNWSYRDLEDQYGLVIEGDPVTLEGVIFKIGICTHGPFAIPEKYRVVTCFICVVANKELTSPISVTMQHCLLMPSYLQSDSILILHADHRRMSISNSFDFEPYYSWDGEGKRKTNPHISSDAPSLSFNVQHFCILCAALNVKKQKQSDACEILSRETLTQNLEVDSPSHHGGEETATRTNSFGYDKQAVCGPTDEQSSLTRKNQKRKRDSKEELELNTKREHKEITVEYVLLMVEPTVKLPPFSVHIFVCENCETSIEECMRQANMICSSDIIPSVQNGTFIQPKIQIKFDIIKGSGWRVTPKKSNSTIKELDVHLLKTSVAISTKYKLYPPRLDYDVSFDHNYITSTDLICTFNVSGFGCTDCTDNYSFSISAPLPQEVASSKNYHHIMLSLEQKEKAVDTEMFLKICHCVKDWKRTGYCLGLDEALLNQIPMRDPYPGNYEYNYQMFIEWDRHKSTAQKTCGVLADAFINAREFEALETLKHVISV